VSDGSGVESGVNSFSATAVTTAAAALVVAAVVMVS
jgi:hypothetical protein